MFLFSMIFSFFAIFHVPTVDIFKFSTFFSFFPRLYFTSLKCIFIFRDFQFFRFIFQVLQCVFLFFTLFSDFIIFRRCRIFSFSMIFSFFAIFHVLQWIFFKFSTFFFQFFSLIFHVLKCVFYFPWFSVCSRLYSRSFSVHFYFSQHFLVISLFFSSLVDVFIFHDFQFCYIPRPYSGYFKFSTFFSFPRLYFTS